MQTDAFTVWQGESDEKSKTSPWTQIAKYKLLVEEELANLDGYEIMSYLPWILCVVNNNFFVWQY